MNYAIENDKLKVIVSTKGAELQSIYGKTTNFEYLWQGSEEFWKSKATNIFPNCGRLWEGKYLYKGNTYELPCHGFVKLYEFEVVSFAPKKITLKLTESEETKKVYPFNFSLSITYSLEGNTLKTEFLVENTGDGTLPFALGGHPGFNVPLEEGLEFNDHYLEFENKCRAKKLALSPSCFYMGENVPFTLKASKIIPLKHSMFNNDAIFLTGVDKTVTLKSDKTERYVKVKSPEMPNVGFWHNPKTKAPFVCIEPWVGVPGLDGVVEDFETRDNFIQLPSGEKYVNGFEIEVNE